MYFRQICFSVALVVISATVNAQSLYHKWYGTDGPALVFIHGGPGYNAASFEMDMAPRLADLGYQVMVYDQRGSCRSESLKGEFTYAEAVEDLRGLLAERGVAKAHLLGHSFGGTIALKFADAHPEMTSSVVLISAPINFPRCFRAIQANCRARYEEKEDPTVKNIDLLAQMDTTTLSYATTNFMYAMGAGLYTPTESFKSATKLKKKLARHELAPWLKKSSYAPVQGFYDKERYTLGDHRDLLRKVAASTKVAAIIGEDDGLFDQASIDEISGILGDVYTLSLASHSVFLDDPYGFLDALQEILRE
jgi:proline iminopeptidase